MLKKIAFVIASCVSMMACEQAEEAFQDRKTRENKTEILQYLAANKIVADSTKAGLYYIFQKQNSAGAKPQVGDEVVLSYIARRLDGVIVDSAGTAKPYEFIRFVSGQASTYVFASVPSFEDLMATGVEKIKEGDQLSLFVPWSLRTSVSASLLSPLYVPLRYDMKVLKVRSEEKQIEDYIAAQKLKVTEKTTDGLRFIKTVAKPDSAEIKAGAELNVTYTGRLVRNGTQFDAGTIAVTIVDPTSTAKGGGVVKGFNDGLAKMRYGEKAIIIFPSALGYGTTGSSSKIPAYAPLYFEVEAKRK